MKVSATNPALFLELCKAHGLPTPIPEYQFARPRKWRFDWAWLCDCLPPLTVVSGIALEIQGGIWTAGRHVRGASLLKEHEKLNEAACFGWRVLFCTPADVASGTIFPVIKRALS